jgi:hypothetical protein
VLSDRPTSFHDYLAVPADRGANRPRLSAAEPCVADDWVALAPVGAAELDVLEIHLGSVLDRLLGNTP